MKTLQKIALTGTKIMGGALTLYGISEIAKRLNIQEYIPTISIGLITAGIGGYIINSEQKRKAEEEKFREKMKERQEREESYKAENAKRLNPDEVEVKFEKRLGQF